MPNRKCQIGVGAVKADLHGTTLSYTTSLRQGYDMTMEYSLESLNFVAFTKPNKHKMKSKGFFYNWARFVFEYFCDSRRIVTTLAKFCLNSLFATCSYRYLNLKDVIQRAIKLSSTSHTRFFFSDVKRFYKILPLIPIVIAKFR